MVDKKSIDELEIIEKALKLNIEKLKIEDSNLKQSIRDAQTQRDNAVALERAGIDSKIEGQKQNLSKMESKMITERKQIDLIKQSTEDRLIEVEKREQRLLNLESQEKQLRDERRDFEVWKKQIVSEMEEAKIKMAEYNDVSNRLKVQEGNLRAREKNYVLKWKQYMDRIGELSVLEKEIKVKTEHLEALQKETVNV